jgi:hypothetical protein
MVPQCKNGGAGDSDLPKRSHKGLPLSAKVKLPTIRRVEGKRSHSYTTYSNILL